VSLLIIYFGWWWLKKLTWSVCRKNGKGLHA
jgi:hypothetical protein